MSAMTCYDGGAAAVVFSDYCLVIDTGQGYMSLSNLARKLGWWTLA